MTELTLEAARVLFPGFGFYAHTNAFSLTIDVQEEVSEVCIAIESSKSGILDLGRIDFYDADGVSVDKANNISSATLTTVYGTTLPEEVLNRVQTGAPIQSEKENRPAITITFAKPIRLGYITIANRKDKLRNRGHHLVCETRIGGQIKTRFENAGESRLMALFNRACASADLPRPDISSTEDILPTVQRIENRLQKAFRECCPEWSVAELAQFLPLHTVRPGARDFHILVAAVILLKVLGSNRYTQTQQLRPLETFLRSSLVVEKLRRVATELNGLWSEEQVDIVIAKHSIHKSTLLKNRDSYLAAVRKALTYFESLGYPLMLCYGTLLGAVRDNSFIPHDDDVDLLYIDGSRTREEALANKDRIIADCKAHGRKVRDTGENFQIIFKGRNLDFFMCWEHDGKIELMMEKFAYRTIDRDILIPPSRVTLFDEFFPAPNNPRAFLEERYGPGWTEANPYYDFPWSVQRFDTAGSKRVQAAVAFRKTFVRKTYEHPCVVSWGQGSARKGKTPSPNSLPTLSDAIESNVDAIKLDIRLTADGVPVLASEDKLQGSDGSILVSRARHAEVEKFCLGTWGGNRGYVPSLNDVLALAKDKDIHVDPHMKPEQLDLLRQAVDASDFDRARLQFSVKNFSSARKLLALFPESVLLWKISRPFYELGATDLDEAVSLGLDGVMLCRPLYDQDFRTIMRQLKERDLRVLYHIPSGVWPSQAYADDPKRSLLNMIDAGADYIAASSPHLALLRQLTDKRTQT